MSPKNAQEITARHGAAAAAGSYWRHAAELRGEVALDPERHREFPSEGAGLIDATGRRNFMKVMGASMMMAGLAGCARQPEEKIVPYVKPPEEAVPGRFQYYATAAPFAGYGLGALAASYEGRPTKIEGLADHPASLGASSVHAQASLLDLYSPDRMEVITHVGTLGTWNRFAAEFSRALQGVDSAAGAGLAILTETVTSPTMAKQMAMINAIYPEAKWYQHDPMGRNNARVGAFEAFGEYVAPVINFKKAKVILSLDADFLHEGPAHVRYAADYAWTRSAAATAGEPGYVAREGFAHDEMSRLYAAEVSPTLTGASADHALQLRHPHVETLARKIAEAVGVPNAAPNAENAAALPEAWVNAVIADLSAHKGHAVVVAGDAQPPAVHALAHAINNALGAADSGLVTYIDSPEAKPVDQEASLASLVDDLNADRISILVILGGNPIYSSPYTLDLASAMEKAGLRVHLTAEKNETSQRCHWVIPESHYLEAWGDIRAYDGTISIVQPLIRPLYNSKTAAQILALILGDEAATDYDLIHNNWLATYGESSELAWRQALSTGVVANSASPAKSPAHKHAFSAEAPAPAREGLDLLFRLDPRTADGRYANNAWLQELPKPLTNLTWDNAVHLHPNTAHTLKLKQEDEVLIQFEGFAGKNVRAAVMLVYGQPEDTATIHLGYGREVVGPIGRGRGFNAYACRKADSPWFLTGVNLAKTGRTYMLARTEEHNNIEQSHVTQTDKAQDRHLIREGDLKYFKDHPDFAQHMGHHAPDREMTLYNPDEKDWDGPFSWGMTIDLNRCTGCGVCTIACQAENNIPVVGKEDVRVGREMHWIRVDRYYKGDPKRMKDEGRVDGVAHQPVPCMQCENAPCEPVCPVGATMHSEEGLNDMVYNRCVGTRYCSNNCPYKVRRFNFFHYNIRSGQDAPQLKMMRNPNVTVRSRGVMEKCTYCTQRINRARIDAKVAAANRPGGGEPHIADGAVQTACQAACPSGAIVFGNIKDPESRVSLLKQNPRDYGLLADIGTRPRTTYLARLRNTNDDLASPVAHTAEH